MRTTERPERPAAVAVAYIVGMTLHVALLSRFMAFDPPVRSTRSRSDRFGILGCLASSPQLVEEQHRAPPCFTLLDWCYGSQLWC